MAPARLAAYLGGATLLAAWLANAAAVPPRTQIAPPPAQPGAAVLDNLASDVQSQAVRLRKRLAAAPAPTTIGRNPFAFRARHPETRSHALVVRTAPEAPAAPEGLEPLLTLDGIAEQNTPGGVVRTAIVTGPGDEVFLVAEGGMVAGRYSVVAVTADGVELRDVTTGAIRRLHLQVG